MAKRLKDPRYETSKERAIRLGTATESEIAKASRPTLNKVNLQVQRSRADFGNPLFTFSANLEAVRLIANEWKRFVDSYEDRNGPRIGKAAFKADWRWIRLRVGLQDRLLIEQVLYDKGGFYRTLVSGFRPLE